MLVNGGFGLGWDDVDKLKQKEKEMLMIIIRARKTASGAVTESPAGKNTIIRNTPL